MMRYFMWIIASFIFTLSCAQGADLNCTINDNCALIVNGSSICVEKKCQCLDNTTVMISVSNMWHCMEAWDKPGGECMYQEQCNYDGGQCWKNETHWTCSCDPRNYLRKEQSCLRKEKSVLIPVAVGVGVGVAILGTLLLYLCLSRRKK